MRKVIIFSSLLVGLLLIGFISTVYAEIDMNEARKKLIDRQEQIQKQKEKDDEKSLSKGLEENKKENDNIKSGKASKVITTQTLDDNSKKMQKRKFIDNTDFEQEILNMKAQNAQLIQKLQQMQKQIDDLQSIVNKLKSLLK